MFPHPGVIVRPEGVGLWCLCFRVWDQGLELRNENSIPNSRQEGCFDHTVQHHPMNSSHETLDNLPFENLDRQTNLPVIVEKRKTESLTTTKA